jgi:hypothetical protein
MSVLFLVSLSVCVFLKWHITVSGFAKVAIFTTNFFSKHVFQFYVNLSYEARSRHFCQTAVTSWRSVCRVVAGIDYSVFYCHCPFLFVVGLRVGCFNFLKRWKKIEILLWVGFASSFKNISLCAG